MALVPAASHAIYNRYGFVKEMRTGLEAWARELTK
jgi:hypothetical protein